MSQHHLPINKCSLYYVYVMLLHFFMPMSKLQVHANSLRILSQYKIAKCCLYIKLASHELHLHVICILASNYLLRRVRLAPVTYKVRKKSQANPELQSFPSETRGWHVLCSRTFLVVCSWHLPSKCSLGRSVVFCVWLCVIESLL